MKHKVLSLFTAAIIAGSSLTTTAQTLKVPAPSPTQTLKQNFALSEISIEYSRPGVKNRVIFGDLVPFGKIWRTGANASTKITFGEDVNVEGKAIAAGTYAIYTIPNRDSWEILFYKDLKLGGSVSDYKAADELLRFTVEASALANKVEDLTIQVTDITPSTANIELSWDKTSVAFHVAANIDAAIMKNIETALVNDSRPYFQAANYYYENDKDLNKALEWVNKAIEQNPQFYIMHTKAKIQMKLKDYKGAIATAEKSLAMAKEAKSNDYVALNEKLIAEAKKK
ncbi:MAG: DUF2911 domain-containing protein [Bacteroidetes bacterium]|nr:DUF2911 domain-containing protein [Bacteroidota bacterium]